jgi:protein-tyrosine phosphatase
MPFGPYDTRNKIFKDYQRNKIKSVLALVTDSELERKGRKDLFDFYLKHGMKPLRMPFPDLSAPLLQEVTNTIPLVIKALESGNLAVHCNAGVGRTGIVVACIAITLNKLSGEEALQFIRETMMVNLTDEQKRFICKWAISQQD